MVWVYNLVEEVDDDDDEDTIASAIISTRSSTVQIAMNAKNQISIRALEFGETQLGVTIVRAQVQGTLKINKTVYR